MVLDSFLEINCMLNVHDNNAPAVLSAGSTAGVLYDKL